MPDLSTGLQTGYELPGSHVPESGRVVDAPGGQGLAVRGEGEGPDLVRVSSQERDRSPAREIPEPDRAILPGGGQEPAVRRELDHVDRRAVPPEVGDAPVGRDVPELHRPDVAT